MLISTQTPNNHWLLTFCLINALFMSLISLGIATDHITSLGGLYRFTGLWVQFSLISILLTLIIRLLRGRLQNIMAVIIFAIVQLIVIANVQIYSLYHFHINGMVMNLVTSGALLENIAFSWLMWAGISALFISVFLIEMSLLYFLQKKSRSPQYSTLTFSLIYIFLLFAYLIINGFADAKNWNLITHQNRYIPWQPPITMQKQLKRLGFTVEIQEKVSLSVKSSGIQYPLHHLHCSAKPTLNILFLIVDSLRADMLTKEIMPFTYQLQSQALNFRQHFSGGNSTRYGMFSLFYGLPGSYWNPMLDAERGSVLFDQTQAKQYQHFIYGSTRLTFPEFDRTFFSSLRSQLKIGSKTNSAENDAEITEHLLKDIQSAEPQHPFFGFLFYDSPHAFSLPNNYPEIFSPRLKQVNYLALDNDYDPVPFMNLYKSTAHYVDSQIQQILELLKTKQLLDDTLVIITSDHGQEFNDNKQNFWGHNSNFSHWQTQVPMMLIWPGKAPQEFNHLSSHEDLIPTLMQEVMGCTNPISDYSTGQSLFNQSKDRSLLMESWTERAIFHQQQLFFVDLINHGKVLDADYHPVKNTKISGKVLQDNLEKMSRFLKH